MEFHKKSDFHLDGVWGFEDLKSLKLQDSSKNVVFGVKMCPYRVLMDHCTNESWNSWLQVVTKGGKRDKLPFHKHPDSRHNSQQLPAP